VKWLGRIFRGDEGSRDGEAPSEPAPRLPGIEPVFSPEGEARFFRARRTVAETDPRTRKRVIRSGVGISAVSQAEADALAERDAREHLADAISGATGGGYTYLHRRAEPVVDVLRGASGDTARITVNSYGALVMNALGALFVDVDTADWNDPRDRETPRQLAAALARDRALAARTYRTAGGWRFLFTDRVFDPAAGETRAFLERLGADPQYVVLTRVQRTFRARLLPKPWRAKQRPLRISLSEGVAREALQRYVDRTWRFATARFVSEDGSGQTIPELVPIVEYHDRWTQAASAKPLA
jgi:hypothetical protein